MGQACSACTDDQTQPHKDSNTVRRDKKDDKEPLLDTPGDDEPVTRTSTAPLSAEATGELLKLFQDTNTGMGAQAQPIPDAGAPVQDTPYQPPTTLTQVPPPPAQMTKKPSVVDTLMEQGPPATAPNRYDDDDEDLRESSHSEVDESAEESGHGSGNSIYNDEEEADDELAEIRAFQNEIQKQMNQIDQNDDMDMEEKSEQKKALRQQSLAQWSNQQLRDTAEEMREQLLFLAQGLGGVGSESNEYVDKLMKDRRQDFLVQEVMSRERQRQSRTSQKMSPNT